METIEVTVKLPVDMVNSFFALLSDLKKYNNTLYSQIADSKPSSQPTGDLISEPNSEETGLVADIIEESRVENRVESREEKSEEEKRAEKREETRREKTGRPEDVNEIKAYAAEKSLSIDPKKFWDYYEKRNWVDGKGEKIQDWKAVAESWEKREWHRKKSTVANFRPREVDDTERLFEQTRKDDNVFLPESGTGN